MKMSFPWGEFVTLSSQMIQYGRLYTVSEDVIYRNAISRSYYGIYNWASSLAREEGVELTQTGRDHGIVRNYFFHHQEKEKRQLGAILSFLRKNRIDADYRDPVGFNLKKQAQLCVERAQWAQRFLQNQEK